MQIINLVVIDFDAYSHQLLGWRQLRLINEWRNNYIWTWLKIYWSWVAQNILPFSQSGFKLHFLCSVKLSHPWSHLYTWFGIWVLGIFKSYLYLSIHVRMIDFIGDAKGFDLINCIKEWIEQWVCIHFFNKKFLHWIVLETICAVYLISLFPITL